MFDHIGKRFGIFSVAVDHFANIFRKRFPCSFYFTEIRRDFRIFGRFEPQCFITFGKSLQRFSVQFIGILQSFFVFLPVDIERNQQCQFGHLLRQHTLFSRKIDNMIFTVFMLHETVHQRRELQSLLLTLNRFFILFHRFVHDNKQCVQLCNGLCYQFGIFRRFCQCRFNLPPQCIPFFQLLFDPRQFRSDKSKRCVSFLKPFQYCLELFCRRFEICPVLFDIDTL